MQCSAIVSLQHGMLVTRHTHTHTLTHASASLLIINVATTPVILTLTAGHAGDRQWQCRAFVPKQCSNIKQYPDQ